MKTTLFGKEYDAPFGVAPIGLQGLIWPNATEILAKAAFDQNVPFILSTVATSSIERVAEITEGKAWFQLYHPTQPAHRDDLLKRAWDAGIKVLVILCDVPSFGFRPRDIRNGLSMPPRMNLHNLLQMLSRPTWTLQTLKHGRPTFANLLPYMPKRLDLKGLGHFMDQLFDGRLTEQRIAQLRDQWKGKLVLKGVASLEDTEMAVKLGLDGIIVSNHGGRQLDAGESTIKPMSQIAKAYGNRIEVMIDSGIRSGVDIARCLSQGASFTFLGRTFMYGVGASRPEGRPSQHQLAESTA